MLTLSCKRKVSGADIEQLEVELGLDQEELGKVNQLEMEAS